MREIFDLLWCGVQYTASIVFIFLAVYNLVIGDIQMTTLYVVSAFYLEWSADKIFDRYKLKGVLK